MLHKMLVSVWEETWLPYHMNKCDVHIWAPLKEKKNYLSLKKLLYSPKQIMGLSAENFLLARLVYALLSLQSVKQ